MSGLHGLAPADDAARLQAAWWFARLRAEDAGADDRARWQAWLDADASHLEAWARLQARWDEMGGWAEAPGIAARLADVPPASRATTPVQRARPRRRRWPAVAIAASVAVVALASVFWVREASPPVVEYATGVGERRAVVLDDGTAVELDTDTRIAVTYSRRERVVRFAQGRAQFSVVNDGRPLRVEAALGEIRVVGTVFEVDQHAGELGVTLVEGRVDVAPRDRAGGTGAVEQLQAGQRVRIAADGRLTRSQVDAQATSWTTGRLVFDDLSLADAVAEFNRYSTRDIRLADPALADIRVSGAFRSDDPAGFVEALHLLYGVAASSDAADEIVLSRRSGPRKD